MEITKIKAQKNKKRVNIYLDGKFAFPLDADNFLKAGLKVGQKLSEKQVEDLIFKNEFQKLYDKTLRLIGARPRSEKEVCDYLKKKIWNLEFARLPARQGDWKFRESQSRIKEKMMVEVINALKKKKLIDDKAFAVWWVEQRSTFRPRGKVALRTELSQKGVNRELAERVINQMTNELVLAKKAAQKKMRTLKKLNSLEFREKMAAFLSRRGFSWETIKQVLDEIGKKE